MRGAVYHLCRRCGKRVNISCQLRQEKRHLCPRCVGEPWYMTKEGLVRENWQGGRSDRSQPALAGWETSRAQKEKCLACSRPDCQGSCPPGRKRLPVPEDFAERVQRGERVKALAKVYGVAYGTVCRWRKEAGLVVKTEGKEVTQSAAKRLPGSKGRSERRAD